MKVKNEPRAVAIEKRGDDNSDWPDKFSRLANDQEATCKWDSFYDPKGEMPYYELEYQVSFVDGDFKERLVDCCCGDLVTFPFDDEKHEYANQTAYKPDSVYIYMILTIYSGRSPSE
jgi:hypothetical protein